MKKEISKEEERLKKVEKIIKLVGTDEKEAIKTIKILIASYDINPLLFVQKIT